MNTTQIETMQADGLGKFVGENTRMPAEVLEMKFNDERDRNEPK